VDVAAPVEDPPFMFNTGVIEQLDPQGDVTPLLGTPSFPWSLAFDGTDFFETAACTTCDGTLVRVPGDGSPTVTMGAGTFAAVDDACVYWSTPLGISSVAKNYTPANAP
jgi:hypothetical protein